MKIDNANPRSPSELVFILDDYGRNARGRQSSRSRAKDLQAKDSTVLQFYDIWNLLVRILVGVPVFHGFRPDETMCGR